MSEYISKEDISRVLQERNGANKSCLIKAKEKGLHPTEQYFYNLLFEDEQISSLIEELTSADVRPNIHGHWEDRDGISDFMYCSNCGGKKHYSEKWIGCPYCLADMREPKPIGVFKRLNDSVTGEPIQDMRKRKCETCKNCNKTIGCSKHIACQRENMKFYEPKGEKGTE